MFSIAERAGRLGSFLLDCLFPKECLSCGWEGGYLCDECRFSCRPTYRLRCFGCQASGEATATGRLCLSCQPRFAFDGMIIAADYEQELVARLIRACKYRFVAEISAELAEWLMRCVEKFLAADRNDSLLSRRFFQAVVTAVPLSNRRRRWRGFNQSELIARRLADFAGLKYEGELLQRRQRRAQATLREAERHVNLKKAFWTSGNVPPLIILVDDVVTTGSTLQECARVLRAAGAEEIWCLVVAKG